MWVEIVGEVVLVRLMLMMIIMILMFLVLLLRGLETVQVHMRLSAGNGLEVPYGVAAMMILDEASARDVIPNSYTIPAF